MTTSTFCTIQRLFKSLAQSMLCGFSCLLVNLFSVNVVNAQGIFNPIGARAWMTGGAAVSQADVWSAANNPGATGLIKKYQGGIYTEQRFMERNLALSNLSAVFPTKLINIGASINHYGYSAFNQQKLGLSLSRALFSNFSLGVQLNYVATNIQDNGNSGAFVPEAGILYQPFKGLNAGLTVFNPGQVRYSNRLMDKVPTYVRLGISYEISEKLKALAEAEQMLDQPLMMRGGISYRVHPVLSLAIGAASNPVYYTFGTSLHLKYFRLDFASSIHQVLGFTPHLGISVPLRENE